MDKKQKVNDKFWCEKTDSHRHNFVVTKWAQSAHHRQAVEIMCMNCLGRLEQSDFNLEKD